MISGFPKRVQWLGCLLVPISSALGAMPPVPVPPPNPITEPKRVLGKILFWDEQLSSDNTVACGTCHASGRAMSDSRIGVHPGADGIAGGVDDVFGSPGVVHRDAALNPVFDALFGFERQVTRRSAPSVTGAAPYSPSLFWDGRALGQFLNPQTGAVAIPLGGALESQSVAPIVNSVEMGHDGRTWADVIAKLVTAKPLSLSRNLPPDVATVLAPDPGYPALFSAAFGDPAVTAQRIAFAIATYERTLIPDQTPWDRFTGGDPNALTFNQQQGLNFFNGSQCRICHTPPLFTNNTFRNIGLRPWQEDSGRMEVTGVFGDRGRFKVPSLRNVGLKRTFMHNGRISSFNQLLDFYIGINGQQQFPENQDPLIPPINVPPPVRPQLIDFLANGLTDPRVANEQFPFDRPWLYSELGDADHDIDVDLIDFAAFLDCADVPNVPTQDADCLLFDFEGDGDVDFSDYALFQLRVSHP